MLQRQIIVSFIVISAATMCKFVSFYHFKKPYINISTNKNKDWEFIKTVETIENSNNVSMLKYGWEMSFSAKLSIANEMMTVFISRAKNFMFHLYDMSISVTLDAKKSDYYTLVGNL